MTAWSRRALLGAGALTALDAAANEHPARGFAKSIEAVRSLGEGLVRVRTVSRVSADPASHGGVRYEYEYASGFFAGPPGYVVTAAHAVRPRKDVPPADGDVSILAGPRSRWIPVDVAAEDPEGDVAVLRANPAAVPESRAFPLSERKAPPVGEPVFALGFRAGAAANEFEMGLVLGVVLDKSKEIAALFHGDRKAGQPWVALSQNILGGYSGGPLLDSTGSVAAILNGVAEKRGQASAYSLAVASTQAAQALARAAKAKGAAR